ncbi:MAG: NADH-quinone oxidoreductase subunit NuoG [Chloroflexi bacterium]|nr:NADH-quinone oxidoreductase subunit NuoG [Chloroflexota bacterium]MCL5274327.1 NADH-quinone oxidoreductase subunit NuoG [Chloroflexota bacterium]
MADLINLTIDGIPVAVPRGTVIVDAAKKINNDIPVFCYHPKLKPVGMCRMCLVEVGTPQVDRATRQVVIGADGNAVIAWMPKLQTACTTPVSEGMAVRTNTKQVLEARDDVLEFLLTSHPLDCPICDKGGECPLQNLTLAHGPGVSRFDYEAKQHNAKHVPLGDLIFLDRERCIQCSRCVRFQDEVADDHVLQFHERGRHMEIITFSDPPFDSVFGGNTTDICPVGALTTADFRFKARPWELDSTPSVCTHCPVGCNLSLNTRLETRSGGHEIKRVMPRQNEQVNEIWICDKGRYVHHFTRAEDRITRPLVRDARGNLAESTWEAALQLVADRVRGRQVGGVIGDRIANEDAYLFARLFREVLKGGFTAMSPAFPTAYADIARTYGVGKDTDFKELGKGDVILLVNCDLEQSAPVWFLRLRQAVVDRGARLIIAHDRPTKMHRYAARIDQYELGKAAHWATEQAAALADELKSARNVLVVFGDEKLSAEGARSLARSLANVLIESGHTGKANSGLLPLYPHANTQGVFDALERGFTVPEQVGVAWLVGVGDGNAVPKAAFTVVQELFLTDLAKNADVVLPALSFAEREGTFTSGDRRVQRFYRALPPLGQARADWWIIQEVAKRLGAKWDYKDAGQIFGDLAGHNALYAGLTYASLGQVEAQWPPVGRADLYYGGAVYDNSGGIGARYAAGAERAGFMPAVEWVTAPDADIEALQRLPRMLYQDGELIGRSKVLAGHIQFNETEIARAAR